MISVGALIEQLVRAWGNDARWECPRNLNEPHEAQLLLLDSSRAREKLDWAPPDDMEGSIKATVEWYQALGAGADAAAMRQVTITQIAAYLQVPSTTTAELESAV